MIGPAVRGPVRTHRPGSVDPGRQVRLAQHLDLRGQPKRDYDVSVSGGVGQATVYLPKNVGIEAEAHGGIGHIEVRGLEKHGNVWQNSLYDTAKVTVRVKVQGGIGEIRIIAD